MDRNQNHRNKQKDFLSENFFVLKKGETFALSKRVKISLFLFNLFLETVDRFGHFLGFAPLIECRV